MRPPILAAERLTCAKTLAREPSRVRNISVAFEARTFSLLHGPAGCGKNLLLRLLGLLEIPDAGDVLLHGAPTRLATNTERAMLRSRHYGFLFAQPFLLPSFSPLENVAMPLFKISAVSADEARPRLDAALAFAGAADLAWTPVDELSLLDQQRIALARALVNRPDILIAENVDAGLGGGELLQIGDLFRRAPAEFGATVLATASGAALAPLAGRVIEIAGGEIRSDSQPPAAQGGASA
jgi:ABC-type lipoprotein export system ATPase subunit